MMRNILVLEPYSRSVASFVYSASALLREEADTVVEKCLNSPKGFPAVTIERKSFSQNKRPSASCAWALPGGVGGIRKYQE